MTQQAFTLDIDANGIGLVTIDMPGRAMNVLNPTLVEPFAALVTQLETDAALKGLVITSAKSTFIVGADIDQLTQITSAEEAFKLCEDLKGMMRRMEKCGKPVVAALNGTALGGGLELALACHARIAIDDPKAKFGLPEVKLGLLPGGGGTQRVPRMIGIQKSFELITQGKELTAAKAKDMGLVTELAANREDMLAKAKAWCLANPKASQPWDNKGFRIPGGDSKSPAVVQVLAIAPSMANAKAHGNYPALTHIMSCLFEGCLLDFDAGSQVESRYFAACVVSQTSKNMIGTLWHQLNAIKKGQSRPKGPAEFKVKKVGILGAGMMGAGIAYVSAKVGIDVVLLDTTIENAEKGKAYSQGILDKAISRGRSTADKRDALLARIKTTTSYEDLAGCDRVIEAVFEDRASKAETTKKDLIAEGGPLPAVHPGFAVVQKIGGEHERIGKKANQGFYDYAGKEKSLWPGLLEVFPPKADQPSQQEIVDRLLYAQANEAARCYEEKVVRSVADTNIGSIFGWGFAPNQGGALQFINAVGPKKFVERARELAKAHGSRFEPAAIVVKMAQEGGRFEDVV